MAGEVNISGGLLELFEDFAGPAIGTATVANAGNVTVTGGSVKTVRSANSYSQKGETGSFHVPAVLWNSAVTATNDYALLPIDVSQYANNGSVTVKVDGKEFYSGSTYKYVTNEVKNPAEFTDGSVTKNATQANWLDNDSKWLVTEADYGAAAYPTKNGSSFVPENNLYLPLSKDDHTITIGNNEIKYYYDEATGVFANYDWYSTSATKQAKVEGAADLTISTPEQLVAFKNIVNGTATAAGVAQDSFEGKTVKLGDDIDMASATNWVAIGNATNQFKGTFDGNSKTINGITATGTEGYMGLFGYNAGTIQNLNISQFCTFTSTTTGDYVGAVAAYNAGTIKGVTSAATVKADSAYNVGGIAGFNDGGKVYVGSSKTYTVTHGQGAIFDCSTSGAVTGSNKVGGITGENAGAIKTCSSSSTVDGTNTGSKNGVGGIAGRNGNNDTAFEEPVIDSCYFTGTVGRTGQKWIGGIAGFNSEKSAITNCYMAGTLVGGGDGGYYNAIAGRQEGASLCSNNYAIEGITGSGTTEAETGTSKTADELKAAAMVTALNKTETNFQADSATATNNGYPVFASNTKCVVNFITTGADSAATPQIVVSGGKATKPADQTKKDAAFAGWYSDENLTAKFNFDNTTITADTKVYAGFGYTVEYEANGGTTQPETEIVLSGHTATEPAAAPTKADNVFAGWYSDEELQTKFDFKTPITANTKLYAKWVSTAEKFKVTFNCGEGATNVPADQEVQAGGKATKPATDPTKTGYTLAGWYKDKDCTEGNEFDFDKDTITEETTLYAKWVAAEYSITYYDGTKVLNLAPDKYIYGEGIAEDKMPKAEKTGYTFDGWYDSATFDKQVTSIAKDATGDVKLYAKFTATEKVTRLAGDDAAQTSAKISEQAFPEGAETVVLCKDDDFKDAMSATGLAGVLDAPILLTSATELSAATKTEIERLKATNVIIIGGTGAIKAEVETAAKTAVGESGTVERIFGNEAEETSVKCAERLATEKTKRIEAGETSEDFSKAIVSMSDNFQDALSMSSFAYTYHIPILLESSGSTAADRSLTADAVTMLKTGSFKDAKVFVPGGTGAVSKASVEDVVGESRCTRLTEGESGYDTSNYIANWLTTNGDKEGETYMHAATTVVATGAEATKGVDALAGAALAGKSASPILLVNTNATLESKNLHTINGFFFDSRADIAKTYVLGGTAVVDTSLEARLSRLLG